ncbi:hypothetical protein IIA16_03890 [bacterium]|nr:hypothetical protein [bacterium]
MAEEQGRATGRSTPEGPVAVLVFHGMGEQVPFETIEGLAANLEASSAGSPATAKLQGTSHVRLGEHIYPRAELRAWPAGEEGGPGREIHIYEAYWAPLAAGHITLRETMDFLLRSALMGLKNSRRPFTRWLFGAERVFRGGKSPAVAFAGLFLILLSSIILNVAALATAAQALTPVYILAWLSFIPWPGFTTLLLLNALVMIPFILLLAAAKRQDDSQRKRGIAPRVSGWLRGAVWGLGILWAAIVLFSAWNVMALSFAGGSLGWKFPWGWHYAKWGRLLLVAGAAGVAYAARWVTLNYLGDLALYLSSGFVSRFHNARGAIKKSVYRVAHDIYSAKEGGEHLYKEVIVVGHSLGSVIAYDTYNGLVQKDKIADTPGRLDIANRTPLFLTFGSPLDKTAFIYWNFRTTASAVRERLAQSKQPLISDYKWRPAAWVNLWSREDVVSGALNYYDPPSSDAPPNPKAIQNLEDTAASVPLAAHNQYWQNPRLGATILKAVLRLP